MVPHARHFRKTKYSTGDSTQCSAVTEKQSKIRQWVKKMFMLYMESRKMVLINLFEDRKEMQT